MNLYVINLIHLGIHCNSNINGVHLMTGFSNGNDPLNSQMIPIYFGDSVQSVSSLNKFLYFSNVSV